MQHTTLVVELACRKQIVFDTLKILLPRKLIVVLPHYKKANTPLSYVNYFTLGNRAQILVMRQVRADRNSKLNQDLSENRGKMQFAPTPSPPNEYIKLELAINTTVSVQSQ